jgi:hypothetical protein
MIDEATILRNRSILRCLLRLLGSPEFNPVSLEITFSGGRKKIKKAAKILDYKKIWYRVEWVHVGGFSHPYSITIQFDAVSFRRI